VGRPAADVSSCACFATGGDNAAEVQRRCIWRVCNVCKRTPAPSRSQPVMCLGVALLQWLQRLAPVIRVIDAQGDPSSTPPLRQQALTPVVSARTGDPP
jgi:hypothetical protein